MHFFWSEDMDDIPTKKLIKAFIADMDPFTKKLIKVFIAVLLLMLIFISFLQK
jgi:hypothetical protein